MKKHEKEANSLRDRVDNLEPLLTETQQERLTLQRQGEQQKMEYRELLLRVFKDINKFLGAEVSGNPISLESILNPPSRTYLS